MQTHRPTMQDVARAAGVHQTTVSLALRNDPRLPDATRLRLQSVAAQLGYTPDPMLSALNSYRAMKGRPKSAVVMAFLANFRDRHELAESYPHRLFLEGARARAETMGYRLEVFHLGSGSLPNGERLEKILRTRGITGLIIGAFGESWPEVAFDWSRFSVVSIESQQLGMSFHLVSSHQSNITRAGIVHLRGLGYRRIGLAVGRREEFYLKNAFTAGYYVEIAQSPGLQRLAPLLLEDSPGNADVVKRWVQENRPDAILSNWHMMPQLLKSSGWRIPDDLVVAALDLTPQEGANAGMKQNHRIVGERAVEQLAILMKTNQRGPVELPNHTLVDGGWIDGTDVPSRDLSRETEPVTTRTGVRVLE